MVFSELWWEFQPGQRVNTKEGYPGVVTAIQDGPQAGNEQYIVELDNGLGGGEYGPSELAPLGQQVAKLTEADIHTESDLINTADKDYPEFGNVLAERPPLAHSIPARSYLNATASVDEDIEKPEEEEEPFPHEAGFVEWDMIRGKSSLPLMNWCRFRGGANSSHCMYPKELNVAATQQAGYPVWVPFDRGPCPRMSRAQQRACPIGQPGPMAGNRSLYRDPTPTSPKVTFPGMRPDATVPWEAGGQRGGFPEPEYVEMAMDRARHGALDDPYHQWMNANGGGFTMRNKLGDNPTNGYMVSKKDTEKVYPAETFGQQHVDDFKQQHAQHFADPNNYVGGWTHKGNVYLDVSRHIMDRNEAIAEGEKHNQLAIWDNAKGEEIPLSRMQRESAYLPPAEYTALGTEDGIFFDLATVAATAKEDDKPKPKRGMRFEHAKKFTGSPLAGTKKPTIHTVTKVTPHTIYHRDDQGGLWSIPAEKFHESVGRLLPDALKEHVDGMDDRHLPKIETEEDAKKAAYDAHPGPFPFSAWD